MVPDDYGDVVRDIYASDARSGLLFVQESMHESAGVHPGVQTGSVSDTMAALRQTHILRRTHITRTPAARVEDNSGRMPTTLVAPLRRGVPSVTQSRMVYTWYRFREENVQTDDTYRTTDLGKEGTPLHRLLSCSERLYRVQLVWTWKIYTTSRSLHIYA